MFKSVFIVGFFTLLARISGFARDVVIAGFLGASKLADVFFIAYKLPNFFRSIFGEGAFNSAFVPIFSDELRQDPIAAKRFASYIFGGLLFALTIFILVVELCMPLVVRWTAPGVAEDPASFALSITLSRIMFVYLLLVCTTAFIAAVLNSLDKFAPGSAAPIIFNLTIAASSLLVSRVHFNLAYYLSYIVLLGGVLQVIWMLLALRHYRFMLMPAKFHHTPNTRLFFRNFIPGVLSACGSQVNNLVDTIIASLFVGAVSYLYYATRLYQLPIAMIGTAISVVILPKFSKIFAEQDNTQIYHIQKVAILFTLFLVVPATMMLFVASDQIIIAIFGRGAFSSEDAMQVARVLRIYCWVMPCFSLLRILNVQFFATKDTRTPMYISLVTVVLNVLLSVSLMHYYQYLGIALATVISSYIGMLLTIIILYRRRILLVKFREFCLLCSKGILPLIASTSVLLYANRYFYTAGGDILRFISICMILGVAGVVYLLLFYPFLPKQYLRWKTWTSNGV